MHLVIFKDRASGIWVVRNRRTNVDLAHESSKRAAEKAARMIMERSEK